MTNNSSFGFENSYSNFGSPAAPVETGFGTPEPRENFDATSTVASPPFIWLVIAAALGLVSALASVFLGSSVVIAAAAWVASGPIAIGLIGVYILRDTKERAKPLYSSPSIAPLVYYGALVAAFVGIILSALQIASWAGRL